jgi:hypothetical protein
MTEPVLAFLDANVLAKPVTRTLLIHAAGQSGYNVTWSARRTVGRDSSRALDSRISFGLR